MVGVDDRASYSFSSIYTPDPVRHRLRERIYVGGEWSVELQMVGGVISNDVDDRSAGSLRVVEIGKAIRQTWTGVKQSCRRTTSHAPKPISCSGHHAFEQAQYASHSRLAIKRGDKVHL